MTEKRFQEYYQSNTIVSIHDKENNNELVNILQCVELLNEQHEENMLLIEDTEKHRKLAIQFDNRNKELVRENALLEKENEQLKKQLWDTTIDYYTETYSDNSIRRDEHINEFKKEFKAKYGDVE